MGQKGPGGENPRSDRRGQEVSPGRGEEGSWGVESPGRDRRDWE